jgi:hypothetical protein
MATLDARPSPFTQITNIADWERLDEAYGVPDGVNGSPGGTELKVSLNSGARTAVCAPGDALIKGQLWGCTSNVSTAIPAAAGNPRIDRLVLRLDRQATTSATVVQPVVITGTPASNPNPPTLKDDTRFKDIPLGQWQANVDGSLVALLDIRQFWSAVYLFTSGQRPTPPKKAIGYESNTDSLMVYNGSTWKYITPTFGQTSDLRSSGATLQSGGAVNTLCSVTFTANGISQVEVVASVPAVYRNQDNNMPPCAAAFGIFIGGDQKDQKVVSILPAVPTNFRVMGPTMVYRTSNTAGDTPSKGDHTVTLKGWVTTGPKDIFVDNDAHSFPTRLQCSPVFE